MIEQLRQLLQLKDLEEEIGSLNAAIKETPSKIDALRLTIDRVKADFEKLKQRETGLKKDYKLKEVDIKTIEEQLGRLNGQLFTVKTNEEYRAMLKEIEGLKQKKKTVEDEMIAVMEEEEDVRGKIKQGEKETASVISRQQEEMKALEARLTDLQLRFSTQCEEQVRVRDTLSKASLKDYERIKKARKTGVSRVTGNTCEGCNASLSHQVINELKKGDKIMFCDYCGRIVIWDGKAPPAGQ